MELRDYFKIIGKYKIVFWTIVILCGISALIWTKVQPQSYLASTTFTVNKASSLQQKDVNYYLYDNYYNIQSAGLFSQIVTTWFSSPALVSEIYAKAGLDSAGITQKNLSRAFKTVRTEPATIDVSISGTNKDDLSKLMTAAGDVLQEQSDALNKSGHDVYEIVKFTPIVSAEKPNLVLNTLIGLFAGLLLSVILILGVEYFKEEK